VDRRPQIWIIAGPNGAGKSTVASRAVEFRPILDPDAICRTVRRRLRWISILLPQSTYDDLTNKIAVEWVERVLGWAILRKRSLGFETVLGSLKYLPYVRRARRAGFEVHMLFVALPDPEDHVQRVGMRVTAGGHSVPESKIRARWLKSHANLRLFLPYLDTLLVVNNIEFAADGSPQPRLVAEKATLNGEVTIFLPNALPAVTRALG
jgi:predicted ABC-type ATPase